MIAMKYLTYFDDNRDMLQEVYHDVDDIFEKVSDDVIDILEKLFLLR